MPTSKGAYDADRTGTRRLPQGAAGETPPETATDTSQGREATPEGELKNEAPTRAYSAPRPVSIGKGAREITFGIFVCACGHPKASHRPHGGKRVPLSGWVCRKKGCECVEYGRGGVTVEMVP